MRNSAGLRRPPGMWINQGLNTRLAAGEMTVTSQVGRSVRIWIAASNPANPPPRMTSIAMESSDFEELGKCPSPLSAPWMHQRLSNSPTVLVDVLALAGRLREGPPSRFPVAVSTVPPPLPRAQAGGSLHLSQLPQPRLRVVAGLPSVQLSRAVPPNARVRTVAPEFSTWTSPSSGDRHDLDVRLESDRRRQTALAEAPASSEWRHDLARKLGPSCHVASGRRLLTGKWQGDPERGTA